MNISSFRKIDPDRNAFWAGLIVSVSLAISLGYGLIASLQMGLASTWQTLATAAMSLVVIATGLYCAWLGSQRKGIQGTVLLILVLNLAELLQAALISETELITAIRGFVVTVLLGLLVLPQRWMPRVTLGAMLVAILYGVLQLFPLPFQVIIPAQEVFSSGALLFGLNIVLFAILLISQSRSLPLQSKFSIASLFSVITAISIITLFIQTTTRSNLEKQIGLQLKSIAIAQGFTIGDLLSKSIESLQTLALNNRIDEQLELTNQTYVGLSAEQIIERLKKQDAQWLEETVGGGTNSPFIQSVLNHPAAQELKEFNTLAQENTELIFTDHYGGLIASNVLTTDYYQGDEAWWQAAATLSSGEAYISSPAFDASSGITSIILAIPIYENGEFTGVLRSTYNIAAFTAVLDQVSIGESGEEDIYFSGEPVLRLNKGQMEETAADQWQAIQSIQGEYGLFPYEDASSVVSRAPVRSTVYNSSIERANWEMVIHQQAAEAFAPVQQQNQYIVLLSIVIGGVITGLSIAVAQVLSGPISILTQATNSFANGDFSVRAKVQSSDEIGELAVGFNEMAASLQQSLLGMEQNIAERTAELTLAGELGRSLARVRDLDELLNTAVDLIQARYNLYYVQLYLVEAEGKALVLRSGTGMVGQELLRRKHRLPVGSGSLNGRAAAERLPMIVADTSRSPSFRPNALLPETRSELAMPLLVGEQVVGVLDMQSRTPGDMNEQKLPAFESLAGQLAIAINNSILYSEAEERKIEVEEESRKLSRQGWDQYFVSVEQQNALGFLYQNGRITKSLRKPQTSNKDHIVDMPISASTHALGSIQLVRKENERWTDDELDIVESISRQVSLQLENLRLLGQAEQYRKQAEEFTRRLTQQAWQNYTGNAMITGAVYKYENNQVTALEKGQTDLTVGSSIQLYVQNEPVGEIVVEGTEYTEKQLEFVQAIAARLSAHLETLRLENRNQQALARTESLYEISQTLLGTETLSSLLAEALEALDKSVQADRTIFISLDIENQLIQQIYDTQRGNFSPQQYTFDEILHGVVEEVVRSRKTQLISSQTSPDAKVQLHAFLGQTVGSTLIAPIKTQAKILGVLILVREPGVSDFAAEDIEMADAVASQFAIAIVNRNLIEQITQQAKRERDLREIAARVRTFTDPEIILRTAARELGQAIGRRVVIQINSGSDLEQEAE